MENLQWEVNRLGAEHQRLRDGDLDLSSRLDLETELQQSKAENVQLVERLKVLEEQLAEECTVATTQENGEQAT